MSYEELSHDDLQDLLGKLNKPFKPAEVKQRTQGGQQLDYIDIVTTIQRLNSVLGTAWDFEIDRASLAMAGTVTRNRKVGGEWREVEVPLYLATVQAHITALGSTRGGVGADVADDPDKALKTAQAEALKKAGHQFGIGLELWDPQVRADIETHRKAARGDRKALKKLVLLKAQNEGCKELNREGLMEFFGLSEEEMDNVDTLQDILGMKEAA